MKNKHVTVNYIDSSSSKIMCINKLESTSDVIVNIRTDNVDEATRIEDDIINSLANSPIFWSDRRCKHYMFDTKLSEGVWLENIYPNNAFDRIDCEIYFN